MDCAFSWALSDYPKIKLTSVAIFKFHKLASIQVLCMKSGKSWSNALHPFWILYIRETHLWRVSKASTPSQFLLVVEIIHGEYARRMTGRAWKKILMMRYYSNYHFKRRERKETRLQRNWWKHRGWERSIKATQLMWRNHDHRNQWRRGYQSLGSSKQIKIASAPQDGSLTRSSMQHRSCSRGHLPIQAFNLLLTVWEWLSSLRQERVHSDATHRNWSLGHCV